MELTHANPNGHNVGINNLQPIILFFSKNIENSMKERSSKFILE